MSRAPIVFIHRGNSHHLGFAVAQARRTNPDRKIILFGAQSTRHFERMFNVRHIPLEDYSAGAAELAAHYSHRSTHGAAFELLCMQRWFILREWMTSSDGSDRCIYVDSDVLIYDDLSEAERDLASAPMTIVVCSAHTSFINSTTTLQRFCDFILSHYTDNKKRAVLDHEFDAHIAKYRAGGISDMTFLRFFREQNPSEIISIEAPIRGAYAFDVTLDSDFGGYTLRDGIKDVHFKNGSPFCWHSPSGKEIRFSTLHFQGKSKQLLTHFFPKPTIGLRLRLTLNDGVILFSRVMHRLRKLFAAKATERTEPCV